jgi:hypothetical protein
MMIPFYHYKIQNLNDVVELLDLGQIMRIRRIPVEHTPEDLLTYPWFPTEGSIINGSRGWLLRQDGWLEICILRG